MGREKKTPPKNSVLRELEAGMMMYCPWGGSQRASKFESLEIIEGAQHF